MPGLPDRCGPLVHSGRSRLTCRSTPLARGAARPAGPGSLRAQGWPATAGRPATGSWPVMARPAVLLHQIVLCTGERDRPAWPGWRWLAPPGRVPPRQAPPHPASVPASSPPRGDRARVHGCPRSGFAGSGRSDAPQARSGPTIQRDSTT